MVRRIKGLFQTLYNQFSKSPKRHLEFMKLAKLMEMKGPNFEECENPLDIYVVPCLVCDGKIQNFVEEDGLKWSYQ